MLGKDGKIQPMAFVMSYAGSDALSPGGSAVSDGKPDYAKDPPTFNYHATAASVVAPHKWNFSFIQACIAILILVGFESVTSMGEEAKNAKRDIPRAVLLSLLIQGVICYLFEYFAANYFLNTGYGLTKAAGSGAPIGDMMVITGTWLFGSYDAARWYMLIQAATVFLALIGTTLSCINTGARVTYAMGRDDEVPSHFGMLHGKKLTPHRAIWTLACVSTVIGILGVIWYLCGTSAPDALNTGLTEAQKNEHLVSQVPDLQQGICLASAQQPAGRHAGEQLRHVPALYADLRRRHRGLPRAPHVQRLQALGRAGLRTGGEPGLHVVLPDRPVDGCRHERHGNPTWPWALPRSGACTAPATLPMPARRRGEASW